MKRFKRKNRFGMLTNCREKKIRPVPEPEPEPNGNNGLDVMKQELKVSIIIALLFVISVVVVVLALIAVSIWANHTQIQIVFDLGTTLGGAGATVAALAYAYKKFLS